MSNVMRLLACVEMLNEIHRLDPTVMPKLIAFRVPCNEALANHPSVQVGVAKENLGTPEQYIVGFLGILNGIFGVREDGYGFIGAEYDGKNLLLFRVLNEGKEGEE